MSKHTPGPWGLVEGNHGCKNVYRLGDHPGGGIFAITEVGYTHGQADESEDAANCRLICAAPEMLELLREHLEMRSMTNGHAALCRLTEKLITRIETEP